MTTFLKTISGMLFFLCFFIAPGWAQTAFERALSARPEISRFADDICIGVEIGYVESNGKLTAEGEARLRGLTRSLVDAGIEITGELENISKQGIPPDFLKGLLEKQQDCRSDVFEYLISLLPPDTVPPGRAPSPVTETDKVISDQFLAFGEADFGDSGTLEGRTWFEFYVPIQKEVEMPLLNCLEEWRFTAPANLAREANERSNNPPFLLKRTYIAPEKLVFEGRTRVEARWPIHVRADVVEDLESVSFDVKIHCDNYTSRWFPIMLKLP